MNEQSENKAAWRGRMLKVIHFKITDTASARKWKNGEIKTLYQILERGRNIPIAHPEMMKEIRSLFREIRDERAHGEKHWKLRYTMTNDDLDALEQHTIKILS